MAEKKRLDTRRRGKTIVEGKREYRHYYKGLDESAFDNNEQYHTEIVKRDMTQGYNFKECYLHWPRDF
ncbi:hypothetical protein pdam_00008608 [Pocillopora damicornis]|uniref:Uncharacterized protein n=1 Tax=Pocillopora damicornis TaxID=46731 RepID=A0A3M6U7Y6_POCDA|nr:hypothetical protein pdam_00008608 [Pocillopora damicornis]